LTSSERLALVERENGEVSVVAQCELLSVSRSGLYDQPRPVNAGMLALQRGIDEIYTVCPFYGVRKITAQLRSEGRLVNHKAVARHMQVMSLRAIYPGPNLSQRARQHTISASLSSLYDSHHWFHRYLLRITLKRHCGGRGDRTRG
jgi:putative transposase